MTTPSIEIAHRAGAVLGEGAVWCDRRRLLWWVDINNKRVNAFNPATGENKVWDAGAYVGCLALTNGDELVLALHNELALFSPHDGGMATLAALEAEIPGNRANDGAVSRDGRFFIGTMPLGTREPPQGTLYRYDGNGYPTPLLGGLHVTNGIAFSPDNSTVYVSDTHAPVRTIWAFDYTAATGGIDNRRVFFDTRDCAGRPDGGCVDTDGCYWMAGVGGGEVLRISPAGRLDMRIPLPVVRPTKPCFGGDKLDTLFVTSIGEGTAAESNDGDILAVRSGHAGVVEGRMALAAVLPPTV